MARNTQHPTRQRLRRIVIAKLPVRPKKYFVGGVFGGVGRIEQIPAQAEDTPVVGPVDIRKILLGMFWVIHGRDHIR